jgi:hypothetical protein
VVVCSCRARFAVFCAPPAVTRFPVFNAPTPTTARGPVNDQSILLSMQRRGATDGFVVAFAQGCDAACSSDDGFSIAAATAANASLVVLVVGLSQLQVCPLPRPCNRCCCSSHAHGARCMRFAGGLLRLHPPPPYLLSPGQEREGHDRDNITLPGLQPELVKLVVSTGVPVVLVLVHGGPLALDASALALPAILDAHYPGEMGGDAVTAVLFGDVRCGSLECGCSPPPLARRSAAANRSLCRAPYGHVCTRMNVRLCGSSRTVWCVVLWGGTLCEVHWVLWGFAVCAGVAAPPAA